MRNYFFLLASLSYLVSWFTKVHTAQKGAWFSMIYGWEAFRVGLGPIWPGLNAITSWSEGKPSESGYSLLMGIIPPYLSIPSALTNGWMIFFVMAWLVKKTDVWRRFLFAGFVACFSLNCFWLLSPLGLSSFGGEFTFSGLCPGYYLWASSFLVAALALMPTKDSLGVFIREVLRRVLFPVSAALVIFAGFFKVQELERNLQKEVDRRKEEKRVTVPPQFRKLSWTELTPIPANSSRISTPFLVMMEEDIKADPSDPEPLLQRAYLHAVWGNEADCRKDFQQALVLSTNRPAVYWSMGWAFLNLGRFEDAEEAWSKAWTPREGQPEPRWVPSAMAMACWKSGKKNQALAWYQRAAEREPGSFTTLADLKERISNWNTKEQSWLIEVHDAWQRTYWGRNSGNILKNKLTEGKTNSSCSTCR